MTLANLKIKQYDITIRFAQKHVVHLNTTTCRTVIPICH